MRNIPYEISITLAPANGYQDVKKNSIQILLFISTMGNTTLHNDEIFEHTAYTPETFREAEFEGCTFKYCDFSSCDLSGTDFIHCRFEHCNLSMAKLKNTGLKEVFFLHCKLTGIEFGNCSNFLFSITCEYCNLNYASFLKKRLKNAIFKECEMQEALFANCDLSEATFQDCNLYRTIFEENNLEGADFTTSVNYMIDPENNRMKQARFSTTGLAGLLSKYELDIE